MPRPALRNHRRQNSFTLRSPQPRKQQRAPPSPNPAEVRKHLESQVAGKAKGKKQGDSDDSDQLVTTRTSGRNRKRIEVYASGGLGKGDKPGAYPSKAQRTRIIREDTQEILNQRSKSASRSASRASSERSAQNTLGRSSSMKTRSDVTQGTGGDDNAKMLAQQKTWNNQQLHDAQTPSSVLGKIKPRKRQDSILKLIQADGNDDSTTLSRDEAEFLPDAVSTPVVSKKTTTPQRSSLKRKRGTDLSESVSKQQFTDLLNSPVRERLPALRSSPEIAQPSRSQRKKLTSDPVTQEEEEEEEDDDDDDDIMALPESSDSEDDAGEQLPVTNSNEQRSKKAPTLIPSTNALQNLMPSRKHDAVGQRRLRGAYDSPRDSNSGSDEAVDESEDESSAFLLESARKKQKRAPPHAKSKAGQTSKSTSKDSKTQTKARVKAKSTNTTSLATPSPVRVRTPLPLSSVKASARNTSAKSPSKQGTTIMRDKTPMAVNTPMTGRSTTTKGKFGRKQYGGYRLRELGKENNPTESIEDLSNTDDMQGKNKSNGNTDGKVQQVEGSEIKAWKKKWANIDDFQMEIEEVSMSTRSSSPMAR